MLLRCKTGSVNKFYANNQLGKRSDVEVISLSKTKSLSKSKYDRFWKKNLQIDAVGHSMFPLNTSKSAGK